MDDVVVLGISSARHSCKVCGKGFPCGRSLGGHMRSHSLAEVAMATDDVDADDYEEESSTRGAYNNAVPDSGGGYGLRENPKKTRRLDGGDECHGDRAELFYDDDGEHDGVLADADDPCEDDVEMLIPTEAAVLMPAPRRRRRSMRVPAPAPPPASSAAFDKEPEDVALCLIMLSRDTPSRWASPPATDGKKKRRNAAAARTAYYHDADSDDTASAFFQYDDDVDEVTAKIKKKRKPAAACLAGGDETNKRGGRYECPGCGRTFQSYQALGGHRASHKRINSNCSITKVVALDQPEPSVETNNTSFSTASTPASSLEVDRATKKMTSSKFECPICFKVFASGQALGGHKRSHSIAGELYERANTTIIVEPEPAKRALVAARFLDLNLPAPGAED